ncbi:MAG: PqqD family peptide modification chaperone [Pseudonocardiaceae bacterium]|nr:PqqD family peptide modification chaperone [Pseudonocardiaceae bacterium]
MNHFAVPANVRYAATTDGAVLLQLRTGQLYGLNPTANAVFTAVRDGSSIEQITLDLVARYGQNRDRIEPDVRSLIASMLSKRLLYGPVRPA